MSSHTIVSGAQSNAEHEAALIIQDLVSVFSKPKGGVLGCQLRKGVYVPILERHVSEGVTWLHVPAGWFSSIDAEKNSTFELVTDLSIAVQSWEDEAARRKRMASAIACELVKSHPLPKVKRFVGSLSKHAQTYYPAKPMIKINKIGMEDIMISLGGQLGLTKQQLFEYIKVTASQQSNPPQAVLDIVAEISHLITYRPTEWVIYDLNVLETDDVRRKNDRFVMLAASGKLDEFRAMVESGHELTCLHSELKYTALHAAADFGMTHVVDYIITTGVSLDMRDPRKQQTALHLAAYNGRQGVIKSLLAANADRTLGDMHGKIPYMYADMQGSFECRELLKFLPPTITDLAVVDFTISTITVTWKCPTINPMLHSEILQFFLDCLPEDVTPEEEGHLTPVPCSPPLPPVVFPPGTVNTAVRIDYLYQKYTDVEVTQVMFSNLVPATTYRIRGKCRSLSGWSHFCPTILQRTLAYVPNAPDPVDICKVSTNGLLLSWRKPSTDNGLPVDFYQIELIDAKMAEPVMEIEEEEESRKGATGSAKPAVTFLSQKPSPNSKTAGMNGPTSPAITQVPLVGQQSTNLHTKRLPTGGPKTSVASRFHRLIKHKNLNYLHKYLTGLEPLRPYQVRVRAHNALGFSPWSGWTGPIAPHTAVTIAQFTPERMAATLTWFAPILSSPTRKVEAYEFQMCCLRGPLTKSIELLTSDVAAHLNHNQPTAKSSANNSVADGGGGRKRSGSESSTETDDSLAWVPLTLDEDSDVPDYSKTDNLKTKKVAKEDEGNEYVTLRNDLTENIYEITGLKAGSRYRCRVRCKINDYPHWNPWDFSIISEIFSMPATPPDPPFMVRAAVGRSYSNAATTAAVVAQEAGTSVLSGTTEFLPRDSVAFTLTTTRPAEPESSIFDFNLSDLIALGEAEDAAARAAADAALQQQLWEQSMFGETPPATAPTVQPNAPPQVQDTLLPILMDSTKIRERVSRKVSTTTTNMGGNKKQSIVSTIPMFDDFAGQDSEVDSCGFEDGYSADSRSMAALAQSVTSAAIARKTDVDIKSGKFTPGVTATGAGTGLDAFANSQSTTTPLQAAEDEAPLEIMHDSITISWQNGQANGLPVEEFRVEMARVRTYRLVDVVRAREAYQNIVDEDEVHDDHSSIATGGNEGEAGATGGLHSILKPAHAVSSGTLLSDEQGQQDEEDCWAWKDITTTGGVFVGFQKFRAEGLVPGATYIFRVKQRNACGWSNFSGASRMIATYPSVPPGRPTVFAVRSTYAAVRWAESDHPGIGLTNIEYEVQIGVVPNVLQAEVVQKNGTDKREIDTVWRTIEVRYFPTSDALLGEMLLESHESKAAISSASVVHAPSAAAETTYVHVMLQKLVSQVTYVLRVRVRTIVGWSPWSAVSAPFRTQA